MIHPDPDIDAASASHESASYRPLADLIDGESMGLRDEHSRPKLPTAVTIKEHIVVLNVNSNRKSVSHGFLAGIFTVLDKFGVVVDLISTSEVHVSMAIEDHVEKKVMDKVVRELRKYGTVSTFRRRPHGLSPHAAASRQNPPFCRCPRSNFAHVSSPRPPSAAIWPSCPSWGSRCGTLSALPDACSPRSEKAA